MEDGGEAYGAVAAVTHTTRSTAHGLAVGAAAVDTTHNNSGIALMAVLAYGLLPL